MSLRNFYAAGGSGSATDRPVFFAVSILKLVLLSLCSLGLYQLYWFYKNWQYVKERERRDIRITWRLLVPYFYCYQLFRRVRDYDHPALEPSSLAAGPLASGWILAIFTSFLPSPFWVVNYLGFVFLIPVQRRVNQINATVVPGHHRNTRFTAGNWIWLVLGGGLLILLLIGSVAMSQRH
jgi:hypothetical protein